MFVIEIVKHIKSRDNTIMNWHAPFPQLQQMSTQGQSVSPPLLSPFPSLLHARLFWSKSQTSSHLFVNTTLWTHAR